MRYWRMVLICFLAEVRGQVNLLNGQLSLVGPYIHYTDVIMGAIASQITSNTIVYSTVYSDADQRKHQSSASLAFVWGIHRGPVNSPHNWPVTRKMFPFGDIIMVWVRQLHLSALVSMDYPCRYWAALEQYHWLINTKNADCILDKAFKHFYIFCRLLKLRWHR